MISISVKLDAASIAEGKQILRDIPKGWPRAAHRSLTRTANSGKTLLGRLLKIRMKARRVGDTKKLIFVHYPSFANLRATLEISKMGRPMIELGAEQNEKGTSYQPSSGGRRQMIPHAFIATGQKRGRQVWLRSRFQIGRVKEIEHRGRRMEAMYLQKEPNIWRFVKQEDINQVRTEGAINLVKNINHEIQVQLNRWAKRGRH